jgi:hypothetical protein
MTRSTKISGVLACFVGLVAVAFPGDAFAIDWGVKLEPGMAAAAGDPQARLFGPGFGLSLKGRIGINRYLDTALDGQRGRLQDPRLHATLATSRRGVGVTGPN